MLGTQSVFYRLDGDRANYFLSAEWTNPVRFVVNLIDHQVRGRHLSDQLALTVIILLSPDFSVM